MRESDNKTGFTRVDHVTFDLIMPVLTTNAQAVFMRIYRQTVGWSGKDDDQISNADFRRVIGISENTIRDALNELEALALIFTKGERTERRSYSIHWHTLDIFHTEWQTSRNKADDLFA